MNKMAKVWLTLIIAPIVTLLLVTFLLIVLKFVFSGSVESSESAETIQVIFNIIIWIFGAAAVFLLFFIPLWIILFIIALSKSPINRTTAVLLAVFFGALSWLYTYKTDATKFWVNNIVSILTFGIWGIFAWIWAITDYAVKPDDFYFSYNTEYINR